MRQTFTWKKPSLVISDRSSPSVGLGHLSIKPESEDRKKDSDSNNHNQAKLSGASTKATYGTMRSYLGTKDNYVSEAQRYRDEGLENSEDEV